LVTSPQAADKEAEATGHIISEGDLFLNGAQPGLMTENVGVKVFHPSEHYLTWTVGHPTDDLKQVLHHSTGWQSIARPADQAICAE
jgi:pectate lyase